MNSKTLENIYNECLEIANMIKNPTLKKCCKNIYNDYKEKLINKPATPGSHHFFKGGLLYIVLQKMQWQFVICILT